ncbi:DUF3530 family protein [Reinekea thalattae]|nr:DUF3530 family protein [Reinekea thalattae]
MAFARRNQGLIQFVWRSLFVWAAMLLPVQAATLPESSTTLQRNLEIYYQSDYLAEQVIQLDADGEAFLALFLEQLSDQPQGGLLLLHDAGASADWPYLLKQLRQYLPEVGWSTLSVSLPIPYREFAEQRAADATTYTEQSEEQWQARMMAHIGASIAELNRRGQFNIVLVGVGEGSYWGTRYLSERLSEEEKPGYSLVLINAPLARPDLPEMIGSLDISTLDLYMLDNPAVELQAKLRKGAAARAGHSDYLQIKDAARQGTYGKPDIDRTTRRVWGWLRNHAAGDEGVLK